MTKDKLKKLMDSGVLQAALEDKPLQYRVDADSGWFDLAGFPDLDSDVEFRVRPQLYRPRVVRYGDYTEQEKEKIGTFIIVRKDGTCYEDYYRDWTIHEDATVLIMRD